MKKAYLTSILSFFAFVSAHACSVLYYIDPATGKIYVVNSEDYWLDVKAYIQINPSSDKELGRLWYGWDRFAQGGINEAGLFFDVAVTPTQAIPSGYGFPKGNFGDRLLSSCKTVNDALELLETEKVALDAGHFMFGDSTGNAVIVEWVQGRKLLHWIGEDGQLLMTNYLLSDTTAGNYPCRRYESIASRTHELEKNNSTVDLLKVGNTFGQAVQPPSTSPDGRLGGTVYTSFIDIKDGIFVLSYQLSNKKMVKLDLKKAFTEGKKRIKLTKL